MTKKRNWIGTHLPFNRYPRHGWIVKLTLIQMEKCWSLMPDNNSFESFEVFLRCAIYGQLKLNTAWVEIID